MRKKKKSKLFFILFFIFFASLAVLSAEVPPEIIEVLLTKETGHINLTTENGAFVYHGVKTWTSDSPILDIIPDGTGSIIVNNTRFNTDRIAIAAVKPGSIKVKDKSGRDYAGIMIIKNEGGKISLINKINLEEYISSVVASEVPVTWPSESLKAQAVAARTYAMYKKKKTAYLLDSTLDQAYYGIKNITPAVEAAVKATRGEILTYANKPALAVFHSTSVGFTESAETVWKTAEFPYLKSVSCPNDRESPLYYWEKNFQASHIEQKMNDAGYDIGAIATFTPFNWSNSGRIKKLRIIGSKGSLILTGENFRKILGYSELPSTRFMITKLNKDIKIEGNGYGHGVGLCQYGAKKMADDGAEYRDILSHYYPGTSMKQISTLAQPYDLSMK